MKQFSHSKLETYKRCPLQYKFRYLTSLKPEGEETIEAFVGSKVHSVLELLYRDLLKTKLNSLDDLIKFYDKIWRVGWKDNIVINNKNYNKEHYHNLGKKCIENYYNKYSPFNQDQTIGVEKKIILKWGEYEIIGYIDRLARDKKGVYSIHDYKTNSTLMDQKYADRDRQLALYSIAVKDNNKEVKEVKLIWHFVAFGEDVVSKRTDNELKELKNDILELIDKINLAEKEDNFPAQETMCDWCGFWKHCPKKKHLYKTEQLPKNEYLKEDGIKLAKKYIELAEKKTDVNKENRTRLEIVIQEMKKIEEAILIYAKKNNMETLDGGDRLVLVNKKQDYDIPRKSYDLERYEELENLLQKTKYWSDISTISDKKLKELLDEKEIDSDLKKKILEIVPIKDSINLFIRKK